MTASADNCLIITGRVLGPNQTRYSPVGLPMTHFVLEHRSKQLEAGIAREARCRIEVLACGEVLVRDVGRLLPGTSIRVHGFISRANYRQGEARLVLHAKRIETLYPHECIEG